MLRHDWRRMQQAYKRKHHPGLIDKFAVNLLRAYYTPYKTI